MLNIVRSICKLYSQLCGSNFDGLVFFSSFFLFFEPSEHKNYYESTRKVQVSILLVSVRTKNATLAVFVWVLFFSAAN